MDTRYYIGANLVLFCFFDICVGDTILSLCSGSGSMSDACMHLGRNCISLDVSRPQYDGSIIRAHQTLTAIQSEVKDDYGSYMETYIASQEDKYTPFFVEAIQVLSFSLSSLCSRVTMSPLSRNQNLKLLNSNCRNRRLSLHPVQFVSFTLMFHFGCFIF